MRGFHSSKDLRSYTNNAIYKPHRWVRKVCVLSFLPRLVVATTILSHLTNTLELNLVATTSAAGIYICLLFLACKGCKDKLLGKHQVTHRFPYPPRFSLSILFRSTTTND